MQAGFPRFRGQIAQLHALDHTLTKRCHAMAPWIREMQLAGPKDGDLAYTQ